MFDWFLSKEKRIAKHQRRITDRDAQAEDREASARWLADDGGPKGLRALLTRFDMNLTHQLNDKDEKEFVYALLASKGPALLKPLRVHLRKCKQFALPIRLLTEVEDDEAAILFVYDLLQIELDKEDLNNPNKKRNMLVWLTERRHDDAIAKATPFLDDFDEGVRHAAMEVVIAQGDTAGRGLLEARMVHPEEDSNRLRTRLAEVFAQRGWTVDDADAVAAVLPPGFRVKNDRIVRA
ncbi:MAG: hypothetical protein ACI8PZ_004887 [Myxococcota bacterium]|jgi:hypothetical protein